MRSRIFGGDLVPTKALLPNVVRRLSCTVPLTSLHSGDRPKLSPLEMASSSELGIQVFAHPKAFLSMVSQPISSNHALGSVVQSPWATNAWKPENSTATMGEVEAWDMPSLRAKLKKAKPGTGEVRKAIENCTFNIGERGFTMLIATFGKSGPWKKALEVFETMSGPVMAARGIRPNAYSYSAIISVCCGAKASTKALELYDEMKAFNRSATLKPSALIYGCLIPECSRASRFETVYELHREMQAFGFQGSDATLLCVLEGLLMLKKWLQAADVLDVLQSRGFVVPQKSYKDLYRACAESM